MKNLLIVLILIAVIFSFSGCTEKVVAQVNPPEVQTVTVDNSSEIQALQNQVDALTNKLNLTEEDNLSLKSDLEKSNTKITQLSSENSKMVAEKIERTKQLNSLYDNAMIDYNNYLMSHSANAKVWDYMNNRQMDSTKPVMSQEDVNALNLWGKNMDALNQYISGY